MGSCVDLFVYIIIIVNNFRCFYIYGLCNVSIYSLDSMLNCILYFALCRSVHETIVIGDTGKQNIGQGGCSFDV